MVEFRSDEPWLPIVRQTAVSGGPGADLKKEARSLPPGADFSLWSIRHAASPIGPIARILRREIQAAH